MGTSTAESWNAEYATGKRYDGDPPVPFVDDIVLAAKENRITTGLYVGCGNGRNYVPLTAAGLDLVGLDISRMAIGQLRERLPERQDRLLIGDLSALPGGMAYPLVIAIQVLQHGTREQVHRLLADVLARVARGGLVCIRANSIGTDIEHEHLVTEQFPDGARTVQYASGPKEGLYVHFWAARELDTAVTAAGFSRLLVIRPNSVFRDPVSRGQWQQWEGIWRREN